MSSQGIIPRPSRSRPARRPRLRCRPTLALLEERSLLTATTISALSQYHSFTTGVGSGPVLVASFTDSAPAPGGYTALINWGDGTSSAGDVSADLTAPGRFNVTGSHTFANQGVSLVSVTVTNESTSASRTVSSVDSILIPPPVVTTIAPSGLAVGGTVSGVTVATFTNLDPTVTAEDFTASIDWGDGTTSVGSIAVDPVVPGRFEVVASMSSPYATAGDQTLTVTVNVLQYSSSYGWSQLASMPEARGFVTPVSTGGLIYEIGGVNGMGQSPQTVYAYDPATDTWSPRASLPGSDQAQVATAGPDGKIYALAYDPVDSYTRMDIYDPAMDSWTSSGDLAITADLIGMTTGPDGLIYLVGGRSFGSATSAVSTYDPTTGTLTSVASLPTARMVVGVVTGPDGKIYAIGGETGSSSSSEVDAYDPVTGTWTQVASLPLSMAQMAVGVGPNGLIYSIGGYNSQAGWVQNAYAYDPALDSWATSPGLPTWRLYQGGTAGLDGRIYIMGNAGPSAEVFAFNPFDTSGSNSATVSVAKGTPNITWANPGDILSGTTLGASELNASADQPGTFAYTPAPGSVPGPGLGQILSVTFTPDDTTNYDTATATVVINVLAPPTVTLESPSVVVGQAMNSVEVATFIDSTFPGATASDFAALITWADSSTATGVITADPVVAGLFHVSVSGPNLSTLVGSQPFGVSVGVVGHPGLETTRDSGTITFTAGPATSFVITGSTTGTAGTSQTITVTAFDAYGNVATDYTGPVQIGTSDPNAVLPLNPTLANGVGTFTIAFRTAGTQSLSVTDPNVPTLTGTESVSVAKAPTVGGDLTASPSPSSYGQPLTLTATYTSPGVGTGTPTGMVDFYDGDTYLGSAPLVASGAGNSATAQFTIATVSPGSHAFRSVYAGDANNQSATSQSGSSVVISPATTSTALSAAKSGQGVTLVATVAATSPGSPNVGGTVSFYDGDTLLATVPVVDGVATYSIASLSAGAHAFRAVYSGDGTSSASGTSIAFNPDGPKVIGLSRYGVGAHRTVLALKFDSKLDAASAANRSNYQVVRRNGRKIAVRSATYDAATDTVTLVTARRLRLFGRYRVIASNALTDTSGTPLDGSGIGHPGTAFAAKVRWTALAMPGHTPAVTFANGHATSYTGRFRQYVKSVLHTTVVALRAASVR